MQAEKVGAMRTGGSGERKPRGEPGEREAGRGNPPVLGED